MEIEIKFRGKDTENDNQFKYGSLIEYPNSSVIVEFDKDGDELLCDVDPDTIGQFSGMQDKNGRDIYEGDIMEYDFGNLIEWCICVFENGSFGVRYIIRFDDGRAVTGFTPFINCINVHKNMKIIGNIHDNPEMIENKR